MDIETLPTAFSPKGVDNTKVSPQRGLGQGKAQETVKVVPEGQTSVADHMGGWNPMDTDDGGRIKFGPRPNTAPEVPSGSGFRQAISFKRGG